MANRRRARITPTDSWPELQLLLLLADQENYEVIRPVVLFGFTPLERSQDAGISARRIYRKAQHFEQYGLPGLLKAEEQSRPGHSSGALAQFRRRRSGPSSARFRDDYAG
jgi:hypothetical protein